MSQQGMPPFSPPMPQPKPTGRAWWIGSAVLHLVCAVFFAIGVWGCVHRLQRVNTDAYVRTHQNAADLMPVYELFVIGLAAVCGLAVAYSVVGLFLTRSGSKAGPIMLMVCVVPVFFVAGAAAAEVDLDGVPAIVFGWALLSTVVASLILGGVACARPQRPPRQRHPVVPMPPPYLGGSPYQRPPSS